MNAVFINNLDHWSPNFYDKESRQLLWAGSPLKSNVQCTYLPKLQLNVIVYTQFTNMAGGHGLETRDLNESQPSYISNYRNFNSNWFFPIPKLIESRIHFVR